VVTALGIKTLALIPVRQYENLKRCRILFFFVLPLFFLSGKQFDISLFILFPSEFPRKNGNKYHNEDQGQQENAWTEIRGAGHHPGPFIPSREEIDYDGDYKEKCQGNPQEELPECPLLFLAIRLPVSDKCFFFLTKHGDGFKDDRIVNIEQNLRNRQVYS
jgi:hypothetical protein